MHRARPLRRANGLLSFDGSSDRRGLPSRTQVEAAAEMFRALGDPERLRLLRRLAERQACVSELAEDEGEKITTVSTRLKTLSVVHLVRR
jgi:DNA-binding transcriptional ArsR family regulator